MVHWIINYDISKWVNTIDSTEKGNCYEILFMHLEVERLFLNLGIFYRVE